MDGVGGLAGMDGVGGIDMACSSAGGCCWWPVRQAHDLGR
jgi:hypothetical protein